MGTIIIIALEKGPLHERGAMAGEVLKDSGSIKIRKRSYNRSKKKQSKKRNKVNINVKAKEKSIDNNCWHGDIFTLEEEWPNRNTNQTL